jgi:sucrose-6-phosphate hydrolase SacC (GH32 family)
VTFSEKNLIVDRRMAGSYTFESKPQSIPMEDNLLNLDVFLDQNLIEILANKGKYVITQHIQPTQNFTKVTLITKETSSIYAIKCQHITLEQ